MQQIKSLYLLKELKYVTSLTDNKDKTMHSTLLLVNMILGIGTHTYHGTINGTLYIQPFSHHFLAGGSSNTLGSAHCILIFLPSFLHH